MNINVVLTEPLNSIDFLSNLTDLKHVSLVGYIDKNISLEVLKKFPDLVFFEFSNGLNKNQHKIIDSLKSLEELRVSILNTSLLSPMQKVSKLRVFNKIIQPENIFEKFANLDSIYLEKCKDLDLDKTLEYFNNLKNIWLRYMPNALKIPKIRSENEIVIFQTTKLNRLQNIDNLFSMYNLEELMMTELECLNFEDFQNLTSLKKLKVAYVTFKKESENRKFIAFTKQNGWEYSQP